MRRLFHTLFAVLVLLGPSGVSHGSSSATHDPCACCEDVGPLATCACGEAGLATPGNRPCSPDSSNRCNSTSDRALPGRTLAIQEAGSESPRPEKRKEPQPWPRAFAEEEQGLQLLLANSTPAPPTFESGSQAPTAYLHRLGILRI